MWSVGRVQGSSCRPTWWIKGFLGFIWDGKRKVTLSNLESEALEEGVMREQEGVIVASCHISKTVT